MKLGERCRGDEVAPLVPNLFCIPVGDGRPLRAFVDLLDLVPDLVHRSHEDLDVHAGSTSALA